MASVTTHKSSDTHTLSRSATALVALATGVLIGGQPSAADDYGVGDRTRTGYFPDSSFHSYCRGGNMSNAGKLTVDAAMAYLDDATEMVVGFPEGCTVNTDVVANTQNLPGRTQGNYQCFSSSFNVCDRSNINIDEGFIATLPFPGETLRKTICHEIGHSVGFTHYKTTPDDGPPEGQSDCMISGPLPNDNDVWATYSATTRTTSTFISDRIFKRSS